MFILEEVFQGFVRWRAELSLLSDTCYSPRVKVRRVTINGISIPFLFLLLF